MSSITLAKFRLSESYGLHRRPKQYRDLSFMVGTWTKEERDEIKKVIEDTSEQIFPEDKHFEDIAGLRVWE